MKKALQGDALMGGAKEKKPHAGAEECNMTTIKLNEMNTNLDVSAEEAADVKGGVELKGDGADTRVKGGYGSSQYQYATEGTY